MRIIKGLLRRDKKEKYSGKITRQYIENDINEANRIIFEFVRDNFGENEYIRLKKLLQNKKIDIDYSDKLQDLVNGYYFPLFKKIYLTNNFVKSKSGKIDIIHTIIHEYSHLMSSEIAKGDKPNRVIEEGFANIFAEMCINDYIQKGKYINTISEADNEELRNYGYYNRYFSYPKEVEFSKNMMYIFRLKGFDMDLFREYYFGAKEAFIDKCVEVYGEEIKNILINDLGKVKITNDKSLNSDVYLPKSNMKLSEMLSNMLRLDCLKAYKRDGYSGLYNIENNLMDSIYFDKIEIEFMKDLTDISGFRNLKDLNKLDMSELVEGLDDKKLESLIRFWGDDIREKNTKMGYSYPINDFAYNWYEINRKNLERFDKILPLMGSIPIEVFRSIIDDYKINDFNSIADLAIKYRMIHNRRDYEHDNNCLSLLHIINKIIGNNVNIIDLIYSSSFKGNLRISEDMLETLRKFDISNESLKKIFKPYGNVKKDVEDLEIYDVIDELKRISRRASSYSIQKGLKRIRKDMESCLLSKKIKDLNLLRELDGIYDKDIISVKVKELDNDVELAMINLAVSGYRISNSREIRENLRLKDFRNIRIEPVLNRSNLNAFVGNYDQTNILFNLAMEDFLQSDELLTNDENLKTCIQLFDPEMKKALNISDRMEKRLCLSIENQIKGLNGKYSEKVLKVRNLAKARLAYLDKKEKSENNDMKRTDIDLIKSAVEASIYRVTDKQIIESKDLIKKEIREKINNKYNIDYDYEE